MIEPGTVIDRYDAWVGKIAEWPAYRELIQPDEAAADSMFPESYV